MQWLVVVILQSRTGCLPLLYTARPLALRVCGCSLGGVLGCGASARRRTAIYIPRSPAMPAASAPSSPSIRRPAVAFIGRNGMAYIHSHPAALTGGSGFPLRFRISACGWHGVGMEIGVPAWNWHGNWRAGMEWAWKLACWHGTGVELAWNWNEHRSHIAPHMHAYVCTTNLRLYKYSLLLFLAAPIADGCPCVCRPLHSYPIHSTRPIDGETGRKAGRLARRMDRKTETTRRMDKKTERHVGRQDAWTRRQRDRWTDKTGRHSAWTRRHRDRWTSKTQDKKTHKWTDKSGDETGQDDEMPCVGPSAPPSSQIFRFADLQSENLTVHRRRQVGCRTIGI